MKKIFRYISVFLLISTTLTFLFAEGIDKNKKRSLKTTGTPSYTHININNVSTWIKNDGETDINPNGNSGFVFPKGSNKAAVFQSGFLYGGKINGEIRVSGSTYFQGQRPGRIINGVAEDESLPHVRIYRVRPDYKVGNLQSEQNDQGISQDEIRAQYEKDWYEWPATMGAPYKDVDGNGVYNPELDVPGIPGADQTVWFVANDADEQTCKAMYGSLPLNIEMQATTWAYALAGPLGNMIFRKYTIVNKGTNPIEEMYVNWWSDPDNGAAGDDFTGCDTTLSLSYIYNASIPDATYGNTPPAAGFDFFQGPMIAGAPTDTAIFNFKKRGGYKNMPMTAHYYFVNSDAILRDPIEGDYNQGTLWVWNLFNGKETTTGNPFKDPAGNVTKFALAGDPIAGTGWVDGIIKPKGDRRQGMVSGPFNLAVGDTQEIVIAELAAGASAGINNMQAVSLLKTYDLVAQNAYNSLFVLPAAPQLPAVKASELDREIILDWGWDQERVAKTEGYTHKEYSFEGYNVYQLPSIAAPKSQAVKIATFDIVNDVKVITGEVFDPAGVPVIEVQQVGSDNGIQRYLRITKDFIKNQKLINGTRYYYAVTAYSHSPNPLDVPNNLENPLGIFMVTPHTPNPGTTYNSEYNKSVAGAKHEGPAEGNPSLNVKVIDPAQVTNADYEINFQSDASGNTTWNLKNKTTNKELITKSASYREGKTAPNVEGILVEIDGSPNPSHDYDNVYLNGVEMTNDHDQHWFYSGATQATSPYSLGSYSRFGYSCFTYDGFNGYWFKEDGEHLYGTHDPAKLSNDIELRFTGEFATELINGKNVKYVKSGGQLATLYQTSFAGGLGAHPMNPSPGTNAPFLIRIPFEVWNVETNQQINITIRQREGSLSANPVEVWTSTARMYAEIVNSPYVERVLGSNEADLGEGTLNMSFYRTLPTKGDVIKIHMDNPLTSKDKFTFSTNGLKAAYNLEKAKADVEKIQVFPNPYYGYNPLELNKYQRFVTFSHLPAKATIKIVNLAGQVVRIIEKTDASQFQRWDLNNNTGMPVGSGLYVAYIEMPDLGETKVLKLAIIQETQVLDRY